MRFKHPRSACAISKIRAWSLHSLFLENGMSFAGYSPQWQTGAYYGEVVFTTGMTGYPESLTDPSYTNQILTFTYPLVGNYGSPHPSQWESDKIHVQGIVISAACTNWSHYQGIHSLTDWLHAQNIPLITGVDTRALTKTLRASGTMKGAITTDTGKTHSFPDDHSRHLVSEVSISKKKIYGNGPKVVIAVDCGMKENIIRSLCQLPITIIRVPHNYDYSEEEYDGVFLSNGPGDPKKCIESISVLKKAMAKGKPIFGICLGAQLLALAAEASTYKLPYGHRGQNQPCIDVSSKNCYITSQNHGYAVDEKSLPANWHATFKNLNDGSVEGIAHSKKPFSAVQFHPEATPGPTDTLWLFKEFYHTL